MFTLLLFAVLLLGFAGLVHFGARWLKKIDKDRQDQGFAAVESAVFALVAFFIAFSFASAQSRLERRTQLLVEEANALGTAYLRVDLCESNTQSKLRSLYRDYVRFRMEGASLLPDKAAANRIWAQAENTGFEIWNQSLDSTLAGSSERLLVAEATNEMLDAATRRSRSADINTPGLILGALMLMSALAAILAGRSIGSHSKNPGLHQWILSCTFALTLTILMDLDHPRLGFIRIEAGDRAMKAVQQMIDRK